MKDQNLKKRMQELRIPEPSEDAKEKTVQAALSEFRLRKRAHRREKDADPASARRPPASPGKGGGIMKFSFKKMILMPVGVVFAAGIVAAILKPNFMSSRTPSDFTKERPAEFGSTINGFGYKGASSNYPYQIPESRTESYQATAEPVPGKMGDVRPVDGQRKVMSMGSVTSRKPPMGRRVIIQNMPPEDQTYIGRDRFGSPEPNPVQRVAEAPVSTFSIDVDTASYAFVRRALLEGHLPPPNAVRVEELINYFDYDYALPPDRSVPFRPNVGIFPTPRNPGTKLLHIGIKGFAIPPKQKPRSNLVFLVDVSGSMNAPDKLPLLKKSLKLLVNALEPEDTISIVVYAGSAGMVLEPTPVSKKHFIFSAIDHLQVGGSTAGGAGIKLAYAILQAGFIPEGVNRVILATDGDFNVGIRDPEALKGFIERKRETGIFLSVLGFGQGNYNDALMQKLAQNGNGNAAYTDSLSEARKVLVNDASGTLFTIARDVKIQVEFNPSRVAEYRLIGYETRRLRREDFNNDQVDAGDVGAGHSVTALYEITLTGSDARLLDDLRYGQAGADAADAETGRSGEYAFLKIRYKLPGEDAPADMRFSTSVAGFGMLLRGDPYLQDFKYRDVYQLARSAVGQDPFGYRSEFLEIVELAERADAMGTR